MNKGGKIQRPMQPSGATVLRWTVPEFAKYEKPWWWYLAAFAAGGGLLIYAIISFNFLFAAIIIMFGVIIALNGMRKPENLPAVIDETGIKIGRKFYRYQDIESFWICYDPPEVNSLYLELKGFRPRLGIPLMNLNPNSVRQIMRKYVREDLTKDTEPLSDFLARFLKI